MNADAPELPVPFPGQPAVAGAETSPSRGSTRARAEEVARTAIATLRDHWSIALVLAVFAATAFVVPTMTQAPVSDDWVYARSVEILLRDHHLRILDLTVVTLVFQVFWGGAFAWLLGIGFGALRVSTLVLVAGGGLALYGLCRECGVARGRAALGAAVYLFNPIAFVLAYSFMSDQPFAALLLVATYCYVRGFREQVANGRWLLAGSVAASLAFLVRQQGALIPFAVVVFLVVGRRLHVDRASARLVALIAFVPAATMLDYYVWLKFDHGVPSRQDDFMRAVRAAGWNGTRLLVERLTFIEAMYVGFFVLPIAAAALIAVPRLFRLSSPFGTALFGGWVALVVAGLALFGRDGRRMPYVGQFLGSWGLGPADLQGGRPQLIDPGVLDWATGVCAVATLVVGLALCRRLGAPTEHRSAAGLTLAIGLWQVVGMLPASFAFRDWTISLDRYLLPLLPIGIVLGLWALRDVPLATPVAWVVVGAYAVFAVAGTRDFLVFQDATWALARQANAMGVPNERLDAGSSWDGYHLWEYSQAHGVSARTANGPWWVYLFAPATDSSYVVSGAPLDGYDIVTQVPYSSWLQRQPVSLYLLRRSDVSGPP
jgi:4-amino-4-deoxy-L-arabinose transferase-like glycosyltransferase